VENNNQIVFKARYSRGRFRLKAEK
jgi:hypothetical protein